MSNICNNMLLNLVTCNNMLLILQKFLMLFLLFVSFLLKEKDEYYFVAVMVRHEPTHVLLMSL